MTCIELQESLAEIERGGNTEQLAHLKTCPECSTLARELSLIASAAVQLRESSEPSPRVWNSIEIALRQEGLIHPPRAGRSLIPSFGSRWTWARWLVPAAAALLIAVGIYVRQHSVRLDAVTTPAVSNEVADVALAGLNDDDLLQEIAGQTPAMRAQYADNLRRVNQYIRDAKGVVDANPNDEEARRSLLEACQQKSMLFELAMDRSLP
jgi:hypothetical protein